MIEFDKKQVVEIKYGKDVLAVIVNGHYVFEKDMTEILVTFNSSSTKDDYYYALIDEENGNLNQIDISGKIDSVSKTANLRLQKEHPLSYLFIYNSAIESIELKKISSLVTEVLGLFNSTSAKYISLRNLQSENLTALRMLCSGSENLMSAEINDIDCPLLDNIEALFQNCDSLERVDIKNFATLKPLNCYAMFENCTKLQEISIINSSIQVGYGYRMFYHCPIKTIPNMDFSMCENATSMFEGCENLTEVILSLPKCEVVQDIFARCNSLRVLNLSLPNNERISNVVSNCPELEDLTINAPKAKIVREVVRLCDKIPELILDFPECIEIEYELISSCKGLNKCKINLPKVKSLKSLISSCSNLEELEINAPSVEGNPYSSISLCPKLRKITCTRAVKQHIQNSTYLDDNLKDGGTCEWILTD